MDATRFQQGYDRVFVPETVAERPRRVALIMDNAVGETPCQGLHDPPA